MNKTLIEYKHSLTYVYGIKIKKKNQSNSIRFQDEIPNYRQTGITLPLLFRINV